MPMRAKKGPWASDNQAVAPNKTKTGVKDIDYEKLAAEILRQQNQAKTLTNEPVNVFPTAVITDTDAV